MPGILSYATLHCSLHRERGASDAIWLGAALQRAPGDTKGPQYWYQVFYGKRGTKLVPKDARFPDSVEAVARLKKAVDAKLAEGYYPINWRDPRFGIESLMAGLGQMGSSTMRLIGKEPVTQSARWDFDDRWVFSPDKRSIEAALTRKAIDTAIVGQVTAPAAVKSRIRRTVNQGMVSLTVTVSAEFENLALQTLMTELDDWEKESGEILLPEPEVLRQYTGSGLQIRTVTIDVIALRGPAPQEPFRARLTTPRFPDVGVGGTPPMPPRPADGLFDAVWDADQAARNMVTASNESGGTAADLKRAGLSNGFLETSGDVFAVRCDVDLSPGPFTNMESLLRAAIRALAEELGRATKGWRVGDPSVSRSRLDDGRIRLALSVRVLGPGLDPFSPSVDGQPEGRAFADVIDDLLRQNRLGGTPPPVAGKEVPDTRPSTTARPTSPPSPFLPPRERERLEDFDI